MKDKFHTNAFIDLNGVPYVLAEYVDKRSFQQIDRHLIRNEIYVDTREPNRAIVDVNVDDIGKRASDGYPATQGNNTKQKNLLNMATQMCEKLNHQFDTLRRGIVIRVNYQLEKTKNHSVIRSMVEDLPIRDRNYFLEVNSINIDDNAIITNFSDTLISNINEFTHGREQMILRFTNIQMFYECLRRDGGIRRPVSYLPPVKEIDYYNYHDRIQNHHVYGPNGINYAGYGIEPPEAILPPTWSMFNRYYHFDNDGHKIVFHEQEINDPRMMSVLIPCGNVQINRAFIINPCHKIIFKFSIWKNDLTIVNDCLPLAQAIQTPFLYPCEPIEKPEHPIYVDHTYDKPHYHPEIHDVWDNIYCDKNKHGHKEKHPHYPDNRYEQDLMKALRDSQKINEEQTRIINQLSETVNALRDIISTNHEGVELPDMIPTIKDDKKGNHHSGHKHNHKKNNILERLKKLEELLAGLNTSDEPTEDEDIHDTLAAQIEELRQQLEEIKNSNSDESISERLDKISEAIEALSEKLDSDECCNIQAMTEDMVSELISKIQNPEHDNENKEESD